MQRFHPRSFCRAEILQKIDPANLIELLTPYRAYLGARGFQLANPPSAEPDYQQLAFILLDADKEAPNELIEALHVIGKWGTDGHIDDLLEIASTEGIDIGEEATPVDLAIRLWLERREAVERMERHSLFERQLAFDHFPARLPFASVIIHDLPIDLIPLESAFNHWFQKNQRGAGVSIQRADSSTEARFLINHGRPGKRVRNRVGPVSRWLHFRPEQTDLVIYDSFRNELRVRAKTLGEVRLYVAEFGKHLFGDESYFVCMQKYTLQPLQERGREALNCRGIDGLEQIRLREIEWVWPAPSNTVETYRSADVFDHFKLHRLKVPKQPIICKATFEVKLAAVATPRMVSIRLPNTATFGRGEEALLIEQWLRKQSFVLPRKEVDHEKINEVMAGT